MKAYLLPALVLSICFSAAAENAASVPTAPRVSEIGVYAMQGGRWTEVLPEVVHWKTGGVLKMLATGGIVKGDINGRLLGPRSPNAAGEPAEFLIHTPEGTAITEYQLVRFRLKKDAREFRTVTGGILHISSGATRDLVPFESRRIAPRTWLVALSRLEEGEYGFIPPGMALSSHASASLGKIYTFRIGR